jgi:polygalacturonase
VTLEITAGSTLLGSPNLADYPVFDGELVWLRRGLVRHGLIVGENLKNVGLIGRGVIDGQGAAFKLDRARPNENRPYLIRLTNCRDVLVEGAAERGLALGFGVRR